MARDRDLAIVGDIVEVELRLEPGTNWDSAFHEKAYGLATIYADAGDSNEGHGPYVWGRMPLGNLARMAAERPEIAYVKPPAMGQALHTTEGVALTSALANFHQAGYKGKGVKIAVIDLGFAGLEEAQKNEELPVSLTQKDFTGKGMSDPGGKHGAHGTAVAEIVHDMAPDAELYLLNVATALNLWEAAKYCRDNGIQIVNHSVSWFNESLYDGKGAISQIASWARDAGILWVNAAGNFARQHYQGVFLDSDEDGWHNFEGQDETININIDLEKGEEFRAYLTWSAWTKLDGDYRLHLFDRRLERPVASSPERSEGDRCPTAVLIFTPPSGGTYHLAISRTSGSRGHLLALFVDPSELGEYRVADHSMTDPAVNERVLAVGAVSRKNWDNGPLEYYSSQGPTNGGLQKPDVCGPARVDTYTNPVVRFLFDWTEGFAGTSAAAPHVAGAAALLWSRFPEATTEDIRLMLTGNARRLGTYLRDNSCGAGLLNLPADVLTPSVQLSSGVRIQPPPPYHVGDSISAQFTVQNTGSTCLVLRALTLGGRAPNGSVVDFPWRNNLSLCPGGSYTYFDSLKIPSAGRFHFFVAYKTEEGEWNTNLRGAESANVVDIDATAAPVTVTGRMMTKSVDTSGCSLPSAETKFLTTDPRLYLWFQVTGAAAGDVAAATYYLPDGTPYRSVKWNPLPSAGSYCYWHYIGLTGDESSIVPGVWIVRVAWNDQPLFTLNFTILRPVAVFDRMMTKAIDTSGCSMPIAATAFMKTDPRAFLWFRVDNAQVGDEASVTWYKPDGLVYRSAKWNPLSAGGRQCLYDSIDISSNPPASSPGNWSLRVSWNNSALFTLTFSILSQASISVPEITSLGPSSVVMGSGSRLLTINGNSFLPTSVITFNGQTRAITGPSDARQLFIQLSTGDVAKAGNYAITVTNPVAGGSGLKSNTYNFYVLDANIAQPAVTAVGAPQRLFVAGDQFSISYSVLAGSVTSSADLMISFRSAASGSTYYYYYDASDPASQWFHSAPRAAWSGVPKTGGPFVVPSSGQGLDVTEDVPSGDYHVRAYFSRPGTNQAIGWIAESDFSVATSTPAGQCFVATAAFGSPMASQVKWLREYRDRFLVTFEGGRALVSWYYRWSPPVASWLASRPGARKLARAALWIPVWYAWMSLRLHGLLVLAGFALLLWGLWRSVRRGPLWWRLFCLLGIITSLIFAAAPSA